MTPEILPSGSIYCYKKWQLIALMFFLLAGCAPTSEELKSVPEDEKVLLQGMAVLADAAETDKSAALSAFEQACEMGNNYGCHKVGIAHNNGLYGKEKNYLVAKQWYEKAAVKGYIPSQLNIANIYAHRLLPLNDEAGYTWLAKAGDGLRECQRGSIEVEAATTDVERQRLCRLAKNNFKKILGIYRKRMEGEDMERIDKAVAKDPSGNIRDAFRAD
jgi:tetratricopeptide (TPR) repeat protein